MFQIQCVTSGKLSHFFFLFKIWNLGAELRSLYSSVLIWARYHFCLIFIESSFNILISSSGSYSHFLHCLLNKPSRMCLLCVFGFMYILLRYTLWYNTCTCFKLNVMYCTLQCVYFLLFFHSRLHCSGFVCSRPYYLSIPWWWASLPSTDEYPFICIFIDLCRSFSGTYTQ